MTLSLLPQKIKTWAHDLGFDDACITDLNVDKPAAQLQQWLAAGMHGTMDYMARHASLRAHPETLVEGATRAIVVRMDYLPADPQFDVLDKPSKAVVSRYAQNKDYHKLIRKRLKQLAEKISSAIDSPHHYRVFTDSAPVLEKPLAQKAGMGWQGKHTNLINSKAGSWFFLGVIYTNLPLPVDPPQKTDHCGSCTQCIDICPTQAIIAPYQLDARRCISYLTIENKGAIPVEFRKAIGNRIYGCDDCQVVCPWNKFAQATREINFEAERGLIAPELLELFAWNEATFLKNTEGSAIRRIGYASWVRNIAVALGNGPSTPEVITALNAKLPQVDDMVAEHIEWALAHLY
jgi:epoxyqueuosine reductase